jgi:hypothetical protein
MGRELSLPFFASFVPLPPVALMIPIFYNRLIDDLSTNLESYGVASSHVTIFFRNHP